MKLLLHTCCAPCSVYCIKSLRKEGIEPTLFWYNPNIHPYAEYKARRDCLKEYAKIQKVELILEDNYGLDEFVCELFSGQNTQSSQNAQDGQRAKPSQNGQNTQTSQNTQDNFQNLMESRCANYCYPKRLRKLFEYAKAHGYDTVSTTLLYSIYQQHNIIKDLMEHLAKEYKINFLYRDFREGWQEGQEEARRVGLYMQKYCGCVFSEEESAFGRKYSRKLKKRGISPTNQNVRKYILNTREK